MSLIAPLCIFSSSTTEHGPGSGNVQNHFVRISRKCTNPLKPYTIRSTITAQRIEDHWS